MIIRRLAFEFTPEMEWVFAKDARFFDAVALS